MTKAELIEKVHATSGTPKAIVERVLDGLRGVMETEFKDGGELSLPGVGKFSVKNQAERKGRNPKTGQSVSLDGKFVPHFKPGKELRDRVNEDEEDDS